MDRQSDLLNKTLVIGIIFLFIVMNIPPSVAVYSVKKPSMPISKSKTLYVGGTGEDNYTTIEDAIRDARGGDTVFVYNGTYYENLVIRDKINLIGENKYTTIIDGSNSNSSDIIRINTDNVKISGFTIQKSAHNIYGDGIECMWHSNLIIEDNIIRDNTDCGICISKSFNGLGTNNVIANNIIINNNVGVIIECPGWSKVIENNNIVNNTITNNNKGIQLYRSYNNTIKYNNITNNLKIGLNVINSKPNFIIKNNFIGNRRNADFSISWIYLFWYMQDVFNSHIWNSNYWDNWKGFGQKIIFGNLGIFGIIPLVQFDRDPAKEPYDI